MSASPPHRPVSPHSPRPPDPAGLAALAGLVLPADCAGCGRALPGARLDLCPACAVTLDCRTPGAARPALAPPGLPPCVAGGAYAGVLRQTVLAYKERGRRRLAGRLAAILAASVAALVPAGRVVLVPVPTAARAAWRRGGDHLAPLAAGAARELGGRARVLRCLRALPRPDSVGRGREERLAAARSAFRPRPLGRRRLAAIPPSASVVVVDDVLTTGATVSAVAALLTRLGAPPAGAAIVAVAERRRAARALERVSARHR